MQDYSGWTSRQLVPHSNLKMQIKLGPLSALSVLVFLYAVYLDRLLDGPKDVPALQALRWWLANLRQQLCRASTSLRRSDVAARNHCKLAGYHTPTKVCHSLQSPASSAPLH